MSYAHTTADPLPVLVVDDDSALIRTLSDILRLHGFAPETAETGEHAIHLAEGRPPALAVVDLRLPDMDGIEVVSRLHELSDKTEVVVLTGNASLESAVAALRQQSIDYLLKPVKVEQLLQVVSAARDRWQRRRVEHALHASEERYRQLFDSNPQPLWVYDRETLRFLAVNDAAVRQYGWSRDEFLEMTIEAIRPEEYVDAVRQAARAPRAPASNGAMTPRVWRHHTKQGRQLDMEITSHDIDFMGRRARLVLGVDVTERMAAQRALEIRARQQETVATLSQRAIVAQDLSAFLQDAVSLAAETLDVSSAAVIEHRRDGSGVIRAAVGLAGTQANAEQVATDALPVDAPDSHRLTVAIPGATHPYGVLTAFDERPRGFTRDDMHFLQAIAHIVGATVERHRTEHAFRQAQRLEAVGRLASGVAHDFNNMLTAITGYAEIVRMGLPAQHEALDDIGEILRAAGRAAGLTRQLLAFSRQQVLQPRLVRLGDVAEGIRKMLLPLLGSDVKLVTRTDPDLGFVKADPGQLEQVILNLAVNARDAMPSGGTLTIETTNVDDQVALRVADTGFGMDAETQARIFEPFFTTKSQEHGTGLGLATVYGIVTQSGGDIRVDSEPGRGTAFTVRLPRIHDSGPPDLPAAPPRARRGGETILLVEDEEAIREVARRILERAGYRVLVARNATEAESIERDFGEPIHLLVTDMMMPGMSGTDLAQRLGAHRPDLRVLLLSGYTDISPTLLQLGATTRFLQKPFATDVLASTVREVLDATPTSLPAV